MSTGKALLKIALELGGRLNLENNHQPVQCFQVRKKEIIPIENIQVGFRYLKCNLLKLMTPFKICLCFFVVVMLIL